MDDVSFRLEFHRALDAIAPPAPWLVQDVREGLRARSRKARPRSPGRPWFARPLPHTTMQLTAIVLVLALALAAAGIFLTINNYVHRPAPAGLPPTVASSPTPDAVTLKYIGLVHNYWIGWQAADGVSNGINQAAVVCLGTGTSATPQNMKVVDPAKCRARAVVLLALHKKFLRDLASTPPPAKFAADDQVFRSQLPKVIADVTALIAAAKTGSKQAVVLAAGTYATDVHASLLAAMDDVEPSVAHI